MQPLRLIISGDYWDSHVYRGRLYLWDMKNALRVYDWDQLVQSICSSRTELALTCAFARGDYLYSGDWSLVFADHDFRRLLNRKFAEASESSFEIHPRRLARFRLGEFDSPFPVLHDDSEIYGNTIYAISDIGLLGAGTHRRKGRRAVAKKANRLWDGRGTTVRAGGGALAIAGLDNGLFEYRVGSINSDGPDDDRSKESTCYQVTERHTLAADWSFASIYGSSDIAHGYLAGFTWRTEDSHERKFVREFARVIDVKDIFGLVGFSWGSQEKIYCATDGVLRVVRFTQKGLTDEESETAFQQVGELELKSDVGTLIGGGVAFFGSLVEGERGLVILASDGKRTKVTGPITRWRVFPRSRRYENHLHVIHEDHLCIYSFNHDYFVEQKAKTAGIEYQNNWP